MSLLVIFHTNSTLPLLPTICMMLRLIVQSGIKMWMGSVYFTTYKSLSEQTKSGLNRESTYLFLKPTSIDRRLIGLNCSSCS